MNAWHYLYLAIVSEVIATTALKASEGFTRILPSIIVVAGYGLAFYLLAQTLRTMPVGVAYAVWSGVGIVLITIISWIMFAQRLDYYALLGIGLIIVGVAVLNLLSKIAH